MKQRTRAACIVENGRFESSDHRLQIASLLFICAVLACTAKPKNTDRSSSSEASTTSLDSSVARDSVPKTATVQNPEIAKPDPKTEEQEFDGRDKLVETNKTILEGLWNFLEVLSKLFSTH
jgi:hypothetical protein